MPKFKKIRKTLLEALDELYTVVSNKNQMGVFQSLPDNLEGLEKPIRNLMNKIDNFVKEMSHPTHREKTMREFKRNADKVLEGASEVISTAFRNPDQVAKDAVQALKSLTQKITHAFEKLANVFGNAYFHHETPGISQHMKPVTTVKLQTKKLSQTSKPEPPHRKIFPAQPPGRRK